MSLGTSAFGRRLRYWRRRRGISQLDLATRAQTTPRHLSFIETGRSRPGRELVLRIARCLDLPVRSRNALLLAAGFPPAFEERPLSHEALEPVRNAIEGVLSRHEPYPASAIDPLGRVVMANATSRLLFPGAESQSPEDMLDAFLAPGPGRKLVENFAEVAWSLVDRMSHDVSQRDDPRHAALLDRAIRHLADVPRPAPDPAPTPILCVRLRLGDQTVRTFSTVLRFEAPFEITVSELRVELMFPMDAEADAFFRSLHSSASPTR